MLTEENKIFSVEWYAPSLSLILYALDLTLMPQIAQSIGTDPTYNTTEYEVRSFELLQRPSLHAVFNRGCQACYKGVLNATSCTSLWCLRTSSISTIIAAVNNRGSCKFGPVVDGGIVPDFPSRLITNPTKFKSKFNRICSDE